MYTELKYSSLIQIISFSLKGYLKVDSMIFCIRPSTSLLLSSHRRQGKNQWGPPSSQVHTQLEDSSVYPFLWVSYPDNFLQTKPLIYWMPLFQHSWKMAFLLLNMDFCTPWACMTHSSVHSCKNVFCCLYCPGCLSGEEAAEARLQTSPWGNPSNVDQIHV